MSAEESEDVRVVLTTTPDQGVAESIAARLLHERLIACANVIPGIRSIYRWQGEVRRDDEVLLMLKSTGSVLASLEQRLCELHPYEVPEVLALGVREGLEAYVSWVRSEVTVGHE
jgi:periplasmic divalent cation tolerance protein